MSEAEKFLITWHDSGEEPKNPANPAFPDGLHMDLVGEARVQKCFIKLPYPAKRCGHYDVRCAVCGFSAIVTTAGRADDPRSITVACNRTVN